MYGDDMVEETAQKDLGEGVNAARLRKGRFDRGDKMVYLEVDVEVD